MAHNPLLRSVTSEDDGWRSQRNDRFKSPEEYDQGNWDGEFGTGENPYLPHSHNHQQEVYDGPHQHRHETANHHGDFLGEHGAAEMSVLTDEYLKLLHPSRWEAKE
jgi:hypothetical protein